MAMFLLIFDDFSVKKVTALTEGDYHACDDGYLELINITDPKNPLIYEDSEWVSVEDGTNE